METHQKTARAQGVLLGLTGLFLCFLLGLFFHDRAALTVPAAVETDLTAPAEEVRPDPAPLDLNTASEEDLTALPGIGGELARRIVAYRAANGPFETVEELTEVSGIGPGRLAALEGLVTVEEMTE